MPSPAHTSIQLPVRVLIASRDPAYRRVLAGCLGGKGFDIYLLESSADRRGSNRAVAAGFGDEIGDLSRIDVLLIETHGLGEAEWLLVEQVRERSPMIEIVAISDAWTEEGPVGAALVSHGSRPLLDRAIQAVREGVFAVLAYPVSDRQLEEAILSASRRKRRGEERIEALNRPASWSGPKAVVAPMTAGEGRPAGPTMTDMTSDARNKSGRNP
jgi:DNA-binding NtrC family response regulator